MAAILVRYMYFFWISLRNLQFSVIEGVGTESEIFTTPLNSRFMNVS
jgi:hypothetical protein